MSITVTKENIVDLDVDIIVNAAKKSLLVSLVAIYSDLNAFLKSCLNWLCMVATQGILCLLA